MGGERNGEVAREGGETETETRGETETGEGKRERERRELEPEIAQQIRLALHTADFGSIP